jgi:uridine kinase
MTRIATLTQRSLPSTACQPRLSYSPQMYIAATHEALAAALRRVKTARPRCGTTKVVAIDGPSGAGKTDFAAALAERLPGAHVLHMDELYPGWDGLEQAVADLHEQVLAPLARGERAAYRRWDWVNDRYDNWRSLPASNLLLVEGVGSGAGPGARLESALIWLEADPQVRFGRCIERDGESYLPHWQRWAAREQALFALDGTRSRADLIINTSR